MGWGLTLHINRGFPELGPLAGICNQQSKSRNSHQLAEAEAADALFPGRFCLCSKIKYTWKISCAMRATGTSWAVSVLGTCLDAKCHIGLNPGMHWCWSGAWVGFGEPQKLQTLAEIDGSCSEYEDIPRQFNIVLHRQPKMLSQTHLHLYNSSKENFMPAHAIFWLFNHCHPHFGGVFFNTPSVI